MTAAMPSLDPTSLQGLPGRVVEQLGPHTEADPAAVLVTFLALAGAYIGVGPHVFAGDAEHPARLWPLVIGATAGGMKGTSSAAVRRVLRAADSDFDASHVVGGLSSGEGLIERVRDSTGDPTDKAFDEGVADKRLVILESEFAAVLARAKREGNALSPLLRQAWDGGRLQTLTRRATALVSTDPHIVVVGQITPTELRLRLAETDLSGGLVNRFMPIVSHRSKRLPAGGGAPAEVVAGLGDQLRAAKNAAKNVRRVSRTPAAESRWADCYEALTPDDVEEGPVAQVVARAVPQVLRLSLTYALLDQAFEVDVPHLEAALAVWRYVSASAEHVFGDRKATPDLDKLAAFIAEAGEEGRTRQAISANLFRGHRTAAQLDALLGELVATGTVQIGELQTDGRTAVLYRAPAKEREAAKEGTPHTGGHSHLRPPSPISDTSAGPTDCRSDQQREEDRRRHVVFGRSA